LGYFSSPCLVVTWLWLPMFASGASPASPGPASAVNTLDVLRLSNGLLAGFAQTGFASGAVTGLLVLIGIAAASRKHAFAALTGAALASAAHLLLHASVNSFDAGLLGFNGALTALALADWGVASVLGGVAVSVALQAATTHFGWPAMTAPFVVATWSVQWLRQRIRRGAIAPEPVERMEADPVITTSTQRQPRPARTLV
jgi:urea transporter